VRKARVRKLKKLFADKYGRVPNGMVAGEQLEDGRVPYIPSEKRRLRKLYQETVRNQL